MLKEMGAYFSREGQNHIEKKELACLGMEWPEKELTLSAVFLRCAVVS